MGVTMLYVAAAFAVLASPSVDFKTKITVSESLRHETLTQQGLDGASTYIETREATRTKLNITIEMPIQQTPPDGATTFQAQVGGFEFTGKLGDDPAYKLGNKSVKLYQTVDVSGAKVVASKVELRWDKGQLTAKVSADSPGVSSVAAFAMRSEQVGKVETLTEVKVKFGADEIRLRLPLAGKVGRRSMSSGDVSGAATTVDLKGQATS